MRYFLELSYKGTIYKGWQRQKNAPSIQQTIEESLSKLLREEVEIVGAGRTDSGVHAFFYIAHFDSSTEIGDLIPFVYHLNSILPRDIAVSRAYPVCDDAHARFDAQSREYKYHIISYKEPFTRELVWQYYVDLDMEQMNIAASHLLEHIDFTTFSKLHSNNKTNNCTITHAQWRKDSSGKLTFTIRADRFLRNMVRAIVGTLVDVGRGKITPEDFNQIILAKDLSRASGSAPSQGLYLSDIIYPKTIKL